MLGAIIGDIVGSIYEHRNIKTKDFPFFNDHSTFTDDSVLTIATMDKLLSGGDYAQFYRRYFRKYPYKGYGGRFLIWGLSKKNGSYNSFGNGSAMRVSPVAWYFDSLDEVLSEAKSSAEVTHNHTEGIKGAQGVAAAIYLAKNGNTNQSIKEFIELNFNYDLSEPLDSIRDWYRFDVTCQGSVPQAIIAFLEAKDFEDAIRNAISIGGDSDTIACITGSIAEAKFGVPDHLKDYVKTKLDEFLYSTVSRYYTEILNINK